MCPAKLPLPLAGGSNLFRVTSPVDRSSVVMYGVGKTSADRFHRERGESREGGRACSLRHHQDFRKNVRHELVHGRTSTTQVYMMRASSRPRDSPELVTRDDLINVGAMTKTKERSVTKYRGFLLKYSKNYTPTKASRFSRSNFKHKTLQDL